MKSGAVFSPCHRYRYALWRIWDEDLPFVTFVGLNPSSADEVQNDPTIRRCIGFARHWGFGGLAVVNLFAYRCPDPHVLKIVPQPVGEANDTYIQEWASTSAKAVICWGNHGKLYDRDRAVLKLLSTPFYLRLTRLGQPAHPLYLPGSLQPIPYDPGCSSA